MESARVGLILDSDYLIDAERQGLTVLGILEKIETTYGAVDLGISVVSVAELMHGAYRAKDAALQRRRLAFIDRLCADVPIYPVTLEIARHVGRLEGELAGRGFAPSFEDLAVGVTALQLDYSIATKNVRHHRLIPGLKIAQA